MKITCTTAEANTIRAALLSHRDKVESAMRRSRKDAEHLNTLRGELDNVKAAIRSMEVV